MGENGCSPGYPRLLWAGDSCLLTELGEIIDEEINARVVALASHAGKISPPWLIEAVPTYRSLSFYVDPFETDRDVVEKTVKRWIGRLGAPILEEAASIEVPVCYGGDYGPDLPLVAFHAGLSENEVISIHSRPIYRVFMLGFTPGFPYLGGMDPSLETPRLEEPRLRIPAGSVGIAGRQTGIYPVESPGGWRLVGCTPLSLFDPFRDPPVLLEAGSMLRFKPIDADRFRRINEGREPWPQ